MMSRLSRMRMLLVAVTATVLAACGGGSSGRAPTATPTGTATPSNTPTNTPASTRTPTTTSTASNTPTDTPTPTITPTSTPDAVERANELLAQLTRDEKISLAAGGAAGVPRLGIPPLVASDGPNGVGHGAAGVTAFPNAQVLAATLGLRSRRALRHALGAEASGKGINSSSRRRSTSCAHQLGARGRDLRRGSLPRRADRRRRDPRHAEPIT